MQTIFVAIVTTLLEMGKKPREVRAALCAAVDSRWVLAAGSPTLPTAAVGVLLPALGAPRGLNSQLLWAPASSSWGFRQ